MMINSQRLVNDNKSFLDLNIQIINKREIIFSLLLL